MPQTHQKEESPASQTFCTAKQSKRKEKPRCHCSKRLLAWKTPEQQLRCRGTHLLRRSVSKTADHQPSGKANARNAKPFHWKQLKEHSQQQRKDGKVFLGFLDALRQCRQAFPENRSLAENERRESDGSPLSGRGRARASPLSWPNFDKPRRSSKRLRSRICTELCWPRRHGAAEMLQNGGSVQSNAPRPAKNKNPASE